LHGISVGWAIELAGKSGESEGVTIGVDVEKGVWILVGLTTVLGC
jgi:hypothetical protein